MGNPQTTRTTYLIPRRYLAAPCVAGGVGILLIWFFTGVIVDMTEKPTSFFAPFLAAFIIIVAVFAIAFFCAFLIASSDLAFSLIQRCQRRGFCKKLEIRRRYVFGVVSGSYLGLLTLWAGAALTSGFPLGMGDLLTPHRIPADPAYEALYHKASALAGQLYVVERGFGLEDICRGILLGVLCVVIWDLIRAGLRVCRRRLKYGALTTQT